MDVVTWILAIVAAVAFLGAGAMKLATPRAKMLENPTMGWAADFSEPAVKAIGAVEVLGAVGLVLPWAVDVAPVLTPLAALGLALTMAGAVVVHLRRGDGMQAAVPAAVLGVLALVVAILRFTQL